jgi:hypothetical protein
LLKNMMKMTGKKAIKMSSMLGPPGAAGAPAGGGAWLGTA